MRYLVDTNVWLELLLEQERGEEVREFLQKVEADQLSLTDFSLYSIGIILTRLGTDRVFDNFIEDTIIDSGTVLLRLDPISLKEITVVRKLFALDFDDAYQYVVAARHGSNIVSFDKHFDQTDRGKMTPAEAIIAA